MMRILFPLLFIIVLSSCLHKDEKITSDANAKLEFSTQTIFFDTIFTSVGSITKRLRVFNRNKNAVTISSIELGGKAGSQYTLTINGLQTSYANNLVLRGGDSIYILVKVTIDPQNQSLPYLVSDSIVFNTNGNVQDVDLMAYGQDATFMNGATVPCDTTWSNIKPFVISNFVRVAPGCTLTLSKGVRVFFHDDAVMNVEGTLLIQGEKDSIVTFSGDKFSSGFEDLPGQWTGIVFSASSKNNSIDWAVLKNALTGIKILSDPTDVDTIAEVKISNTQIKNMQSTAVEAQGTDVYAYNSLFANCVNQTFSGIGGGNYHFRHCTFANFAYGFFREGNTVAFTNHSGALTGSLKTRLTNCIVWGDLSNELLLDDNGTNTFDFSAATSIIKTTRSDQNVNGNLINADPLFVLPQTADFHLKATSPAINAGQDLSILEDLDGKLRDSNPDIGAYEK